MADNDAVGVDVYDDVIEDLITGEGFPEDENSEAPAAKRARMV